MDIGKRPPDKLSAKKTNWNLNKSRKSCNSLDKYPTMHRFEQEYEHMCIFCYRMAHCGIWDRWMWDLCIRSTGKTRWWRIYHIYIYIYIYTSRKRDVTQRVAMPHSENDSTDSKIQDSNIVYSVEILAKHVFEWQYNIIWRLSLRH